MATALLAPLAAPATPPAVQLSGATLWALNCRGCHQVPEADQARAELLRGQFAHTATGRVFFIRVPGPTDRALSAAEEAQLVEEILTWKRSCGAIRQGAPLVRYGSERERK